MGIERVSYYANCTTFAVQFPAATINFSMTTRTVVRVWDAWFSGDTFQLDLNNDLLPIKAPFQVNFLIPGYLDTPDSGQGFRNEEWAWSEFILDNPSEWTLKVSVRRGIDDSNVSRWGFGVQQFIETIPFEFFNRCPFF